MLKSVKILKEAASVSPAITKVWMHLALTLALTACKPDDLGIEFIGKEVRSPCENLTTADGPQNTSPDSNGTAEIDYVRVFK